MAGDEEGEREPVEIRTQADEGLNHSRCSRPIWAVGKQCRPARFNHRLGVARSSDPMEQFRQNSYDKLRELFSTFDNRKHPYHSTYTAKPYKAYTHHA